MVHRPPDARGVVLVFLLVLPPLGARGVEVTFFKARLVLGQAEARLSLAVSAQPDSTIFTASVASEKIVTQEPRATSAFFSEKLGRIGDLIVDAIVRVIYIVQDSPRKAE